MYFQLELLSVTVDAFKPKKIYHFRILFFMSITNYVTYRRFSHDQKTGKKEQPSIGTNKNT